MTTPRDLTLAAATLIRASFVLGLTARAATGGFLPPAVVPPLTESRVAAIVGGEPTSEWPSTVALLEDLGSGYAEFFCSGTLIRSDVVLTAAHCLSAATPDLVYFGTAPFDEGAGGTFVPVADVIGHPGYTGEFREDDDAWNDMALVFLAEEAPVVPIPERVGTQGPGIGSTVWYVGFGQTGVAAETPTKKEAEGQVEQWLADGLLTGQENGSPCFGDSGGSLYTRDGAGTWQVTGVISFVTAQDCADDAGAIRTDRHDRWICRHAGSVDGGPCPDDGDEPWADWEEGADGEGPTTIPFQDDDRAGCAAALGGRGDTWRLALGLGLWVLAVHRSWPGRRGAALS